MNRHEALRPLSRDHHNVLVHARRLRGLDSRFDAANARSRFLAYWPVVALHFDEEERVLAPRISDAELVRRLKAEHDDLRRRAADLPAATSEAQIDLGAKLREHVRFEEDVLFPHLEAMLSADDWAAVVAEGVSHRKTNRPTSIDGGESCFL
ncbi:MAG: hemerythrin domain-containing protein [Thermoplasmatota archaeon]